METGIWESHLCEKAALEVIGKGASIRSHGNCAACCTQAQDLSNAQQMGEFNKLKEAKDEKDLALGRSDCHFID